MIYDFCVVGGGIVGLSTALSLLEARPGASILIIEKERAYGEHQTGHNSGVIHAGIYYKPKSLKAELCRAGEAATKAFCDEHGIRYKVIGKLVVATNALEAARLENLRENALQNGIEVEKLSADRLKEREPHVLGVGALYVPASGIVNYKEIAAVMAGIIAKAGGETVLGAEVKSIRNHGGKVEIVSDSATWTARQAVVCGGLQADRLARSSGLDVNFQIVPFRGNYYRISDRKHDIVRHMIYPVPDPALPFLGIHLTPMIDGSLTVGPSAVLGFAREGYGKCSLNLADTATFLRFPGFWKVIGANLKSGVGEMADSIFKSSYLKKCRKYCPELDIDDLHPYRSGIRAQAVTRSGEMMHDFHFLQADNILHVCNAPSPAATSAIPIGKMIVNQLLAT